MDWSYALTVEEEAICAQVGWDRQLPYLGQPEKNMNYSEGNFGVSAGEATDVDNLELTPPPAGIPLNSYIGYSIAPPREFEEKAVIETEEELNTPEGRARIAKQQREDGVEGGGAAREFG